MNNEKKLIPSAGPSITQKEIELVTEAVTYGWYEKRNMHIDQFLKEFSDYLRMEYCLPTSSCTSAIHLALLAFGINPGDEVIVPDITWAASAAPITYVGATPVFADIDRESWCMDPESFEQSITCKTKAVIIVDLFGNMPKYMDELVAIARKHNLLILEDTAEGIGASHKSRPAGSFGDISVFSFNATKLVMSGQGGMFVTNNQDYYERARKLHHHGMAPYTPKTTFWSEEIGYNYQWTNIQAALALAQFRRLDEIVAFKKKMFFWYYNRLRNIEGVTMALPPGHNDSINTYWISVAIVDPKYGKTKEYLMDIFQNKYNIDLRPYFYPISSMPAYEQYVQGKNMKKINQISYEISPYGICLPSAMSLTEEQVEYVCECLKKTLI